MRVVRLLILASLMATPMLAHAQPYFDGGGSRPDDGSSYNSNDGAGRGYGRFDDRRRDERRNADVAQAQQRNDYNRALQAQQAQRTQQVRQQQAVQNQQTLAQQQAYNRALLAQQQAYNQAKLAQQRAGH